MAAAPGGAEAYSVNVIINMITEADMLSELQRYADALACYTSALNLCELTADTDRKATIMSRIGLCYSELGYTAEAMAASTRALLFAEKHGRTGTVAFAHLLKSASSTLIDAGDFPRALDYSERALDILRRLLPPEHPAIASSLYSVGLANQQLGYHEAADRTCIAANAMFRRSQQHCAGPGCLRNVREDGAPLDVCVKCRRTFYCGKDCQTADWKREGGHKAECKALIAEGKTAVAAATGGGKA